MKGKIFKNILSYLISGVITLLIAITLGVLSAFLIMNNFDAIIDFIMDYFNL